jgi:hypothetical protein
MELLTEVEIVIYNSGAEKTGLNKSKVKSET